MLRELLPFYRLVEVQLIHGTYAHDAAIFGYEGTTS